MVVTEAAVLACALLDAGEDGRRVRARLRDQDVIVPEAADLQAAAVLGRLVDTGRLSPDRARLALADLRDLPLDRVPHWPFLARAWQLHPAMAHLPAITVAIAEAYGATLLTGDPTLARAAGPHCCVELL